MAKKSVSPAPKPAPPKPKAPAPKVAATKAPTAAAPPLTSDAVGDAAGGVWKALHDGGELTLAALKKASGAAPDVTLMAVGWLAREGKLEFRTSGKTVKVSLRG